MFNNRHIDWSDTYGPGMGKAEFLGWNQHLKLGTRTGTKQIRLNSVTWTNTSGNLIGVSSKPAAGGGAGATADIKSAEFSPRFNSLTSGGSLIGISVDPILKGTTGADGDLSGAMRGIEVTMTDDNAGTRTITGLSAAIRIRQQLAGTKTFTGGLFAFEVLAAGGGCAWNGFAAIEVGANLAAKATGANALPGTVGWVRIKIGDTFYKLPAYDD